MNFWEIINKFLNTKMETPPLFGLFHCGFIVLFTLLSVGLVLLDRKKANKYKLVLIICWALLIIAETLKELATTAMSNGVYNFYYFPFVICSSPFYVLPFIAFIKNEKIRSFFESYACWVFMLGGIIGFFYPAYLLGNYKTYEWYICFHTLFHHGLMLSICVYIMYHSRKKFSLKFNLSAIPVVIGFMIIGVVLCAIINPNVGLLGHDRFTGYLMSWTVIPNLPILSDVWKAVPYGAYVVIYLVGFIIANFIVYVISSLIVVHKLNLSFKELTIIKFIRKQKEINKIKNENKSVTGK